jgi:hypothetical protein
MGAIMDGFTRVCIHTDSICPAYRNTLDGAALRSYVATGFAFEISVLFEEKTEEELGRPANISDFARNVLLLFCILADRRIAALKNPDTLPRCESIDTERINLVPNVLDIRGMTKFNILLDNCRQMNSEARRGR